MSGTWVMKADVTDIVLGPERTIERAEARGNVVVEDRADGRRGEGSRATWRPQTDAVTLEGRPATALDGKGNRMTGARPDVPEGERPGGRGDGTGDPEPGDPAAGGIVTQTRPRLAAEGLKKSYRGRAVVDDVSLQRGGRRGRRPARAERRREDDDVLDRRRPRRARRGPRPPRGRGDHRAADVPARPAGRRLPARRRHRSSGR